MTTTQRQCFTCGDDIGDSKNAALFWGKYRHVCQDCAEGVHIGIQELKHESVSGEYLCGCPDNEKELA